MSFSVGRIRGRLWGDTKQAVSCIEEQSFNVSCKNEREFEIQVYNRLDALKGQLNYDVIGQFNNSQKVASSDFFGKKHRPDMSIKDDGTAIELKYIKRSLDSVKTALGQGFVYRKTYKFVVLVLIVAKDHENVYNEAYMDHRENSDLDHIFYKLAEDNIFTMIKPAFVPKSGYGKITKKLIRAELLARGDLAGV